MDEKTVNINKRKIYITLLIVVICLIGVSYAFFTLYLRQSQENTITSLTCLSTFFEEESPGITLTNAYAVSDEEGMTNEPFTFYLENKCNETTYVYITIDSLNEGASTNLDSSHVKYNLSTYDTTDGFNAIVKSSSIKRLENGHDGYIIKTLALGSGESIAYDLRLWVDEATSSADGLGKTWSGQIVVVSEANAPSNTWDEPGADTLLAAIKRDNIVTQPLSIPGKEVSGHTLSDISDVTTNPVSSTYQKYYWTYGTGWKANGTGFDLTGAAVTTDNYANSYPNLVGKYLASYYNANNASSIAGTMKPTTGLSTLYYVVSATSSSYTYKTLYSNKGTTEAVLASTEDDYGTSYYFRGAVKNNFVEYANMCWRIVRVTGDGSIKLVLYNRNGLTSSNTSPSSNSPCSVVGSNLAAASAAYFNKYDTDPDNAYIGLMYGDVGASTYAATHANTNPSNILTSLDNWYTNVLSKQANFNDNQLADTIWCNDKSVGTDDGDGNGIGTLDTYYAAQNRKDNGTPSLICPNDENGGKLSKFTVNDTKYGNGALKNYAKIGLLTADEVAFAGEMGVIPNLTTYLFENITAFWWTLSPSWLDPGDAVYVQAVARSTKSSSIGELVLSNRAALRPALSLKSDIKIASGNGTATNPYKVVME